MKEAYTFDQYQADAINTLIYPGSGEIVGLSYATLGLVGEAGEIAEKVKKIIRDKKGVVSEEDRTELVKELGDVFWYIGAMCHELGDVQMEDAARMNVEKLNSRKARGKLNGSGDNR